MNLVFIQLDSLNRHFLSAYGNGWVRTPNLDWFARRAVIFDQHYTGSLPCMPARREIWTGTEECWWRGWGPLEPWDRPLAYQAGQAGIVTGLVTDHYHFFEWGAHSYHHDFDGYECIRGHEHDNHRTQPLDDIPAWAERMVQAHGEGGRTYLRNVADFQHEEDFFAPKVMTAAARWLRENHQHEQFYLHVDSFDVHEPFHIPEPYRSMYTDLDPARFNPWPIYSRCDEGKFKLSEEEIGWIRAQFAGKLTMVDTWLGRVFETLTELNLWDTTAVIITTDHGHYLGEHGRIGKPLSPLWNTLTHIPLLMWFPGSAPRRTTALTQTVDLHATALELLGLCAAGPHSRSFAPVIHGELDHHRELAVSAYSNQRVMVTDGQWTLLRDHDPALAPAQWHSLQVGGLDARSAGARRKRPLEYPDLEAGHFIPGVSTPQWRSSDLTVQGLGPPRPDLLYHTAADPGQQRELAQQEPAQVKRLADLLSAHLRSLGVPAAQFQRLRLGWEELHE